jgi:hypothetical protein
MTSTIHNFNFGTSFPEDRIGGDIRNRVKKTVFEYLEQDTVSALHLLPDAESFSQIFPQFVSSLDSKTLTSFVRTLSESSAELVVSLMQQDTFPKDKVVPIVLALPEKMQSHALWQNAIQEIFLSLPHEELLTQVLALSHQAQLQVASRITELKFPIGTKVDLTHIDRFYNLQRLFLCDCGVQNKDIKQIAKLEKLQELDLSCNTHITDRCISDLVKLSSLRFLNLDECTNLSSKVLEEIAKHFPELTTLFLYGTHVRNQGFTNLCLKHKQLQRLQVFEPKHSGFDKSGLLALKHLRQLKELCVPISDC